MDRRCPNPGMPDRHFAAGKSSWGSRVELGAWGVHGGVHGGAWCHPLRLPPQGTARFFGNGDKLPGAYGWKPMGWGLWCHPVRSTGKASVRSAAARNSAAMPACRALLPCSARRAAPRGAIRPSRSLPGFAGDRRRSRCAPPRGKPTAATARPAAWAQAPLRCAAPPPRPRRCCPAPYGLGRR